MHWYLLSKSGLGLLSVHWYYQDLVYDCYRPSVIFFPDIFATITLLQKQIIAIIAGYYACGAFICTSHQTRDTNTVGINSYVSFCKYISYNHHVGPFPSFMNLNTYKQHIAAM